MVVLKCHLSEESFKKKPVSSWVYDICEHLVGEPAYVKSDIVVTDADEKGNFYISLGGDYNKDELVLDVVI